MTAQDLKTLKTNRKILKEIEEHLELFPYLSFNQAIVRLGLTCIIESEGNGYEYRFEIIDLNDPSEDQLNRIQINKNLYGTN